MKTNKDLFRIFAVALVLFASKMGLSHANSELLPKGSYLQQLDSSTARIIIVDKTGSRISIDGQLIQDKNDRERFDVKVNGCGLITFIERKPYLVSGWASSLTCNSCKAFVQGTEKSQTCPLSSRSDDAALGQWTRLR